MTESNEDRVTNHLVKEVKKIIESQRAKYGENYAKALEIQFLVKYIFELATYSLHKFSNTKTKAKPEYDLVAQSFSELKGNVQEAVGTAFSMAMSDFAGKSVDYYCSLQMISDPLSRTQH